MDSKLFQAAHQRLAAIFGRAVRMLGDKSTDRGISSTALFEIAVQNARQIRQQYVDANGVDIPGYVIFALMAEGVHPARIARFFGLGNEQAVHVLVADFVHSRALSPIPVQATSAMVTPWNLLSVEEMDEATGCLSAIMHFDHELPSVSVTARSVVTDTSTDDRSGLLRNLRHPDNRTTFAN